MVNFTVVNFKYVGIKNMYKFIMCLLKDCMTLFTQQSITLVSVTTQFALSLRHVTPSRHTYQTYHKNM